MDQGHGCKEAFLSFVTCRSWWPFWALCSVQERRCWVWEMACCAEDWQPVSIQPCHPGKCQHPGPLCQHLSAGALPSPWAKKQSERAFFRTSLSNFTTSTWTLSHHYILVAFSTTSAIAKRGRERFGPTSRLWARKANAVNGCPLPKFYRLSLKSDPAPMARALAYLCSITSKTWSS